MARKPRPMPPEPQRTASPAEAAISALAVLDRAALPVPTEIEKQLATATLAPHAIRAHVKEKLQALSEERELPPLPEGLVSRPRHVPELTLEFIDQLAAKAIHGVPAERCAQSLGVIPRVFRRWLDYGRAEISALHVRLLEVVELVEAEFEVRAMARISDGDLRWQSDAWKLERLYPDRYALRTKTEMTGASGGPIVIGVGRAQLPPEEPE